jgi:acyl-coenzyme A thioesterase PaaI-like protein
LIGNPSLPALHGGSIAAFLEISAIIELSWMQIWRQIEDPDSSTGSPKDLGVISLPKTIDFSVDYLRSGLPRDAYARATVNRAGRRYSSVHVEAWQDNRNKLFAQGTGHFLMPVKN